MAGLRSRLQMVLRNVDKCGCVRNLDTVGCDRLPSDGTQTVIAATVPQTTASGTIHDRVTWPVESGRKSDMVQEVFGTALTG